jgi:hypothetical protein
MAMDVPSQRSPGTARNASIGKIRRNDVKIFGRQYLPGARQNLPISGNYCRADDRFKSR